MRSSKIVEVRAQLAEHYGKFATIAEWLADVKVSKSLFVRNEIKMSLLLEYSKVSKYSATPLTRSSRSFGCTPFSQGSCGRGLMRRFSRQTILNPYVSLVGPDHSVG